MPTTVLRQSDIPTPTDSIYMLSTRDLFALMLTGHTSWYNEKRMRYELGLDNRDIVIVTGKKGFHRQNEITIRHALAAGIKIHTTPFLKTLYQRGYNASIAAVVMHHGIQRDAAIQVAKYIQNNAHDRLGTTELKYTDVTEYLYAKGTISKNTKMAFSRDFLKLSHGKESMLSRGDALAINFHWTVFTRLIEYRYTTSLMPAEETYLDLLIRIAWYTVNAEKRFQQTLKAKGIIK